MSDLDNLKIEYVSHQMGEQPAYRHLEVTFRVPLLEGQKGGIVMTYAKCETDADFVPAAVLCADRARVSTMNRIRKAAGLQILRLP